MEGRRELKHGRVADHDLRAKSYPCNEAPPDQPIHVRHDGACERGKTEDREIELIGEAATIAVAQPAGTGRATEHADECGRDEPRVQGTARPAILRDLA